MKIDLDGTTLADDAHNRTQNQWGGPRVEGGGWEQQIQVSMPIGAANATLIPRGNLVGTLAFSTTWLASSLANASAKALSWQKESGGCPRSGTLRVGGANWGAAVVERLNVRVRGVEVTATYSIKYALPAATSAS